MHRGSLWASTLLSQRAGRGVDALQRRRRSRPALGGTDARCRVDAGELLGFHRHAQNPAAEQDDGGDEQIDGRPHWYLPRHWNRGPSHDS